MDGPVIYCHQEKLVGHKGSQILFDLELVAVVELVTVVVAVPDVETAAADEIFVVEVEQG